LSACQLLEARHANGLGIDVPLPRPFLTNYRADKPTS
jgi:hypothetical protein